MIMKKLLMKFFALCLSLFCVFGMINPIYAESEDDFQLINYSITEGKTQLEQHDNKYYLNLGTKYSFGWQLQGPSEHDLEDLFIKYGDKLKCDLLSVEYDGGGSDPTDTPNVSMYYFGTYITPIKTGLVTLDLGSNKSVTINVSDPSEGCPVINGGILYSGNAGDTVVAKITESTTVTLNVDETYTLETDLFDETPFEESEYFDITPYGADCAVYYGVTPKKVGQTQLKLTDNITVTFNIVDGNNKTLTDVNGKTDHKEDIDWLVEKGITKGFPDGTYRPYSEITRCDMAAFLRRFAAASGKTDAATWTPSEEDWNRFSDVSKETDHAEDILWLAHTKITFGFKDGSFKPYANITRCDMAAFLNRIYNKIQYDADIQENINNVLVNPASDMPITNFTDVDPTTDHYFDIQCIAAMNITTGYPDGSFRPYDSVVRCDMAAFLHRTFNEFY